MCMVRAELGGIMDSILQFEDREAFRAWLKKNSSQSGGIWVQFSKIDDASNRVKPMEALEEALCFGWIDGKIKKIDEEKYIKYFSKRSDRSKWSELNKRIIEKLVKEKKMKRPGLETIEKAKIGGYWEIGYDKKDTKEDIERFKRIIKGKKVLYAEYNKLTPSRQKQYAGFYFDAKQEATRLKRLEKIEKAIIEKSKGILY
jgi:uncharacterized protein YdeI (YjbR/CyaY-like superfamily)